MYPGSHTFTTFTSMSHGTFSAKTFMRPQRNKMGLLTKGMSALDSATGLRPSRAGRLMADSQATCCAWCNACAGCQTQTTRQKVLYSGCHFPQLRSAGITSHRDG